MSAEVPASRKDIFFQYFVWNRNGSIAHTKCACPSISSSIQSHFTPIYSKNNNYTWFLLYALHLFYSNLSHILLAERATKGMFARQVLGRSKRKRGRGGKSTEGPGWGHGHTCHSLHVIYCPEPRQQTVEFKEISNEKFLIQRPKALVEPCLLPRSLLHAINTYIRHIKSLDQAVSYASTRFSQNLQLTMFSRLGKCWSSELHLRHPLTNNIVQAIK